MAKLENKVVTKVETKRLRIKKILKLTIGFLKLIPEFFGIFLSKDLCKSLRKTIRLRDHVNTKASSLSDPIGLQHRLKIREPSDLIRSPLFWLEDIPS